MKMTVAAVRKLIREAKGESDLPEGHGDIKPGHWYVGERGGVTKVKRVYTKDFGPEHGSIVMVDIAPADGSATISQRLDAWQDSVHPASSEEIHAAQEAVPSQKATWRRGVETSRERA